MPGPNYGPNYDDLSAFLGMKGSANDAIKLRNARENRQGELDDNLANDPHNARLQKLSAMLNGDLADDPYTGIGAQATQAKTDEVFHQKDMYQDPRMAELRTQQEQEKQKNMLGESTATAQGTDQGKLNVAGSDLQRQVLDEASHRKQAELAVAPTIKNEAGPKLTAGEQSQLDRSKSIDELGPQILDLMHQDYPGIQNDQAKYASPTDMLGSAVGGWLYSKGHISTPNEEKINQLTGLVEAALPGMVQSGRVNATVYADLKKHTPQVGLSPGANYARLKTILDTIGPAMVSGIRQGHQRNALAPSQHTSPNDQNSNYVDVTNWK